MRNAAGEQLFPVITGADWKRSLDAAALQPNAVSAQIKVKLREAIEAGRLQCPLFIGPRIPGPTMSDDAMDALAMAAHIFNHDPTIDMRVTTQAC